MHDSLSPENTPEANKPSISDFDPVAEYASDILESRQRFEAAIGQKRYGRGLPDPQPELKSGESEALAPVHDIQTGLVIYGHKSPKKPAGDFRPARFGVEQYVDEKVLETALVAPSEQEASNERLPAKKKLGRFSLTAVATNIQSRWATRNRRERETSPRTKKVLAAVGATVAAAAGVYLAYKGLSGGQGKQTVAQGLFDHMPDTLDASNQPQIPAPRTPSSPAIDQAIDQFNTTPPAIPQAPPAPADLHHTVQPGDTYGQVITDGLVARGHAATAADVHQAAQITTYMSGDPNLDLNLVYPSQEIFFSKDAFDIVIHH